MLKLPQEGIRRSVKGHNSRLSVFVDWLEANVLFESDAISTTDVVDILCTSLIYKSQGLAHQFAMMGWRELERRKNWMGKSCPYQIKGRVLERRVDWKQSPGLSFCLALSLTRYYGNDWPGPVGTNYVDQGDIFERLTVDSLRSNGWNVLRTGWASGLNNPSFDQVVDDVASELGESYINSPMVAQYSESNELGLDLVCHRPFRDDRRGGKPAFLVQCGSGKGKDVNQKTKTPDLDIWCRLISFSSNPKRAFVTPHSFEDKHFYKLCNRVDGLVVDRYRLLSPGYERVRWVSQPVRADILRAVGLQMTNLPNIRA